MNLTPSMMFRLLAVFIGTSIIAASYSFIQAANLSTSIFAPFVMATGVFVVMFGCVPNLGKHIINAIVSMVKIFAKILSSMF